MVEKIGGIEKKGETDEGLFEWVRKFKEEHIEEWKKIEEIQKILVELGVRGYQLSGTIENPVIIPYCITGK